MLFAKFLATFNELDGQWATLLAAIMAHTATGRRVVSISMDGNTLTIQRPDTSPIVMEAPRDWKAALVGQGFTVVASDTEADVCW